MTMDQKTMCSTDIRDAGSASGLHMTPQQLTHAFLEAPRYTDPDAFVSDLLLSAAFLAPGDAEAQPDLSLAEPLRRIWDAACLPFGELLRELGHSQTALSRRYCIPIRTVQDWAGGRRNPPGWVRLMLAELTGYLEAAEQ